MGGIIDKTLLAERNKMIDPIHKDSLYSIIPLGGRRVPLCSSAISGEMDDRMIKLIAAECSDLLLRGCTRENPAPCVGFFYYQEKL